MFSSLKSKFIVWFAVSSFALAAISTLFMYFSVVRQFGEGDENVLAARVHSLRLFLNTVPDDKGALEQELEWKSSSPSPVITYARVLGPSGDLIAETREMGTLLPAATFPKIPEGQPGQRVYFKGQASTGEPLAGVAARIEGRDSRRGPWTVQVAMSRVQEEQFLVIFQRKVAGVLCFGLIVAGIAGWFLVRRGIRPVERLVEVSKKIRTSTLNERIRVADLPDELRELALTLNQVLDRLEDSFMRLSRFSADIAHELRTPLNNLRGETEVALGKARTPEEYREVLGSNLEEYDRLTGIIESLLFLARAEDPKFQVKRELFDVRKVLEEQFDFYDGLASEAGVSLRLESSPRIEACLEKTLFLRAVGNVVLNAIRYTKAGGSVITEVALNGQSLEILVKDTGCGIDQHHLPRLFERFYRADPSRAGVSGGVGLGLSIVKTIAEIHDGKVEIESEPGKGTTVRLTFRTKSSVEV